MKRFLLSLLWPAAALVFAVGGTHLSGTPTAARAVDGPALQQTPAHTCIQVTAQVMEKQANRDGQLTLDLQTHQGLLLKAYVSADAGPLVIETGERYEFTGTLASQQLLVLDRPNCLKHVASVQRQAVQAEVMAGWAMVPAYGLKVRAPGLADGYHRGFLVSRGESLRFEP